MSPSEYKLRISWVVLVIKNLPASAGDAGDARFDPWVGKISWRRKWQPTPVFFSGESARRATVRRVAKSQIQLSTRSKRTSFRPESSQLGFSVLAPVVGAPQSRAHMSSADMVMLVVEGVGGLPKV